VDYFTTTALQLDNDTLALYYGAGDATVANEWSAPENFSTTEKGVTIVMFDGSDWVAIDCGRVSIRREAGLAPDPEYFLGLPLRFTLLSPSGGVKKLKWIADQLGAA
jgi:hypothetical protein